MINRKKQAADNSSEIPSDDVLVRRIFHLRDTIAKEREAHAKEVAELKDRIDVLMEINAKLRQRNDDHERRSEVIADRHIDILATLMAAYPFTSDKDLEFEFGNLLAVFETLHGSWASSSRLMHEQRPANISRSNTSK